MLASGRWAAGSARPAMNGPEIERLIQLLGRLPGLGPRSARRVALHLLKKREALMQPLSAALADAARAIRACSTCGNLDTIDPCSICADPRRDPGLLCVVEDVGDLWAMERGKVFSGRYHVLGGTLSALDGIGPDELNIGSLLRRVTEGGGARGHRRHQRHRRRPDHGALPRRAAGRLRRCR